MGFDYEQFGDRVRALRKERDITQAELASVLNVESHYISRIERGLSGCSIEIIIVLSKVLGVSIDYLVVGKEYSSVKEELERVINQLEKIRMDIVCRTALWKGVWMKMKHRTIKLAQFVLETSTNCVTTKCKTSCTIWVDQETAP